MAPAALQAEVSKYAPNPSSMATGAVPADCAFTTTSWSAAILVAMASAADAGARVACADPGCCFCARCRPKARGRGFYEAR